MATVNYTYAEIQNGFHGLTHNNNPTYPDRLYGLAGYGCWSGKITGTQAIMQGRDYAKVSYAPYIGNLPAPTLNVSVSGGMPDGTDVAPIKGAVVPA